MLRRILVAFMLSVFLAVALAVFALLLAFRGSPGDCGGGRQITSSPALAQSYEQRWLEFNAQLIQGRPATLTVSDSDATSRTQAFLAASDGPVHNVRLCFVISGADVNGTISPPFGPDIRVRAKGGVDLSGSHPRATIESIQIGGLPSFVVRPFRGLVTRIIDHQADSIELDHRLTIETSDGQVVITGQP